MLQVLLTDINLLIHRARYIVRFEPNELKCILSLSEFHSSWQSVWCKSANVSAYCPREALETKVH